MQADCCLISTDCKSPQIVPHSEPAMSTTPLRTKFSSINPDNNATLEQAVESTYEAVVDDDDIIDEDAIWLREQRHLNKALHWLRRPSVLMMGASLFLFAFAISSAESTRQMITFKLACNYVVQQSGDSVCNPTDTQVLVSNLQQAYSICSGITTIFALGKVGPMSDQYGRKVFVVLIVVLQMAGKLLRYMVMTSFPVLRFGPMVLTEVLANLCGGTFIYVTLANCYVSDISEAQQRIYHLGLNVASLFMGLSTGPLVGNLLLSLTDEVRSSLGMLSYFSSFAGSGAQLGASTITRHEFVPLRFELGVLGLVFVFAVFVLPESRSEMARRKSRTLSRSLLVTSFSESDQEPQVARIFQVFNFLRPLRLIGFPADSVSRLRHGSLPVYRWVVTTLVIADCVMTSMAMPLGEVYVLYGIFQFDWTAQNLGHLLAVSCATRAFTLIVLSPLLNHKLLQGSLGLKVNKQIFDLVDYSMVMFAFVCEIIGMVCVSSAPTSTWFLTSIVLTGLGSLASPALNSAVVKFYPESKIGELFGAMALVKNVCAILSPVVILTLYKKALKQYQFPQVVFVAVAGLYFVGIVAVTYAKRLLDKEMKRVDDAQKILPVRPSPQHGRNVSFSAER